MGGGGVEIKLFTCLLILGLACRFLPVHMYSSFKGLVTGSRFNKQLFIQ